MKLEQLKKQRDETDAQIKQLEEHEWPRAGDVYYKIGTHGYVIESSRTNEADIEHLYRRVFRTEEDAETYKTIQDRLIELRGDWKPVWGKERSFRLYFDHDKKLFKKCVGLFYQSQGTEYMLEKIADKLLK